MMTRRHCGHRSDHVLSCALDVAALTGRGKTAGLSSLQVATAPLYVALESHDPREAKRITSDLHERHWVELQM